MEDFSKLCTHCQALLDDSVDHPNLTELTYLKEESLTLYSCNTCGSALSSHSNSRWEVAREGRELPKIIAGC